MTTASFEGAPARRTAPAPIRPADSYIELSHRIRDAGLLNRRYRYYWLWIISLVGAFIAIWVAVFRLGDTWFQLVPAALLGVVVTQFGFLGHDAAHRQIFVSPKWNEWMARLTNILFAGLSYGWWTQKHNRHHSAPNQEGKDPDIGAGVLAFTPTIALARTGGFAAWFTHHQGYLFFPLLLLEGINLHIGGVRTLIQGRSIRHRRLELSVILARLAGYPIVLFLLLSPGKAFAFLAVQLGLFGLLLGGSFAPAHKGMPIVPKDGRVSFLHRQVLTSRNVRGGPLTDLAMGGLNYQIEHHLFPTMPMPNLRRAQPIVRAFCREQEISYAETSLTASYGIVIRYLNAVGLKGRDPFACPLVQQLRG